MYITTGHVRDHLHWSAFGDNVQERVIFRGRYEGVRLLPAGDSFLNPNMIYIAQGAQAWAELVARMEDPTRYLLLISNCPAVDGLPFNAFFAAEATPAQLMEAVCAIQNVLSEWDSNMLRALIDGAPLQTLVDLSADALKNPLLLLDSSMQVLAHSQHIAEEDDTFHRAVALGYTPPEVVGMMVEKGYDQYGHLRSGETSIRMENSVSPYAEVVRHIQADGHIICGIIMHCSVVEETEGLVDVLDRFVEHLKYWFKQQAGQTVRPNEDTYHYEAYFYHLLDGREISEKTARGLNEAFHFPFEAGFHLFVLSDLRAAPVHYSLARVLEALPDARCVRYEGNIVGITAFQSKYRSEETYTAALLQTLEYLTQSMQCNCGISRTFRSQLQMRIAYIQAKAAAEIGNYLMVSKNIYNTFHMALKSRSNLFFYDDLCIHHMARRASEEVPLEQLCLPELFHLLEYDKENNTDNYRILYIYLMTNQKTTEAAKLLHMHRNNVTYRIKRIEELFGLDLEDAQIRLKVQYSFCVLDLLK